MAKYENGGIIAGDVIDVETIPAGNRDKTIVVVRVSEPDAKYPNTVPVSGWGDDAELLAGIEIGDVVRLETYIRGHEYKGRYYADVTIRKALDVVPAKPKEPANTGPDELVALMAEPVDEPVLDDDAMPF